jgi:hypothetical protein
LTSPHPAFSPRQDLEHSFGKVPEHPFVLPAFFRRGETPLMKIYFEIGKKSFPGLNLPAILRVE